ncbi:hypothetical protein CRE_05867 [Caenorhabditis remanei]|uniref:Uncharacterized protein n=1 Tax=Caenorhabditis remanei TaxID=31234 RepID=E3MNH7_CAERE|nr:hypothetical protein CRE_05867 [Caenorhabditis remanei]
MLMKIVYAILALLMVTAFSAPTLIIAEEEVVVGHTAIGHAQIARPAKTVFRTEPPFCNICCKIIDGKEKCGQICCIGQK